MSRTPLFAAVKKALAVASHENGVLGADEAAIVATLRSGGRRAGARTRLGPARLRQEARTELDCHRRRRRRRTDGCIVCSSTARSRFCSKPATAGADACSPNTISIKACSASSVANSSAPAMKIAEPRLRGRRGDADLTSVWRSPNSGLPAPSNGTFYSDLGFQNLWETSRVQPGEAGIITDYLGSKPGLGEAKSALDAFRADLPKMSQKMADSSIPMRSRPGSGASIRSRLAAMPAPKRDNTPHCLTWWRNPRSTAVCYLPASIPWRSPKR